MRSAGRLAALLSGLLTVRYCSSYAVTNPIVVKGSAAKPYEKKKVAVFGAGGYLGACIYGFLQRAGSLYGTGIAGIGAPRSITATAVGSSNLNIVLGKHFILAHADESFVKLTDMTSIDSIRARLKHFDAVFISTRYTFEARPVSGGSYEKSPNDKTLEFYMERPRSSTVQGIDDPEYSEALFKRSVEACREEGIKRVVVIETDSQFEAPTSSTSETYLKILENGGVPYLYIQPVGTLENFRDYTYAKGIQGDLEVQVLQSSDLSSAPPETEGALYREDLAAFCVQSLLSLDWSKSGVLRVKCSGELMGDNQSRKPSNQEWCAKSDLLSSLLTPLAR